MANGVPMFSAVYWPKILAPVVFNLKLTAGRLFWSKAGCASVKWSPFITGVLSNI